MGGRLGHFFDLDVEPKIGVVSVYPPKWMVKIMEDLIKHGMIWGVSHIFGNTHFSSAKRDVKDAFSNWRFLGHFFREASCILGCPAGSISLTYISRLDVSPIGP